MIFQWLAYSVPWWVWLLLGLTVAGAIQYFWGWKKALAALIGVLAIVFLQRARQQGWKDKTKADEKVADKMVADATAARAKAAKAAADPKKLRDDDGFRRN